MISMLVSLSVKIKAYDLIITNLTLNLGKATLAHSPKLVGTDDDYPDRSMALQGQLDDQHLATLRSGADHRLSKFSSTTVN